MLTLIIPVRDWPTDRLEASIQSFLALKSKALSEILVVDFGSKKRIRLNPKLSKMVRCLRLEAPLWSLAEAINAGVVAGRNGIFAKTDADILIDAASRSAFDETAQLIAAGRAGLAVTQTVDLGPETVLAGALAAASAGRPLAGTLRPKWGQGGLVFFSRQSWNHIGGFESRFTGWGNEDNDFQERMRQAGLAHLWTDRERLKIYHVWHPPSYARTGIASQRQKNQEIARSDRSVFRAVRFRHCNFLKVASPAVIRSIRPLVTLAVATAGRPGRLRMLKEAIGSFRDQADNDVEVFVVDNGSSDQDHRSLRKFLDTVKWPAAVRLERLRQGSIPKSRNIISGNARGRYICVVDDDDIALPNRLADHLRVFEKDGRLHGCHGGWIDFDEATGLIERNQGKERTLATLLKGTGKITAHPASLYRADVMKAVPYDEAFALGSDLDLALRLAMQGFEIAHTRSYVTLRRFHESNVTLTGLSNQVSNGLLSRNRVAAALGWDKLAPLAEKAKAGDGEVYCANTMALDTILGLLPDYVGVWRLFVPVQALERPSADAASLNGHSNGHGNGHMNGRASRKNGHGNRQAPQSLIEQVHTLVPGELCMRRAGSNRPVCFRSVPVKGLGKALALKARIEALLGQPIEIVSDRQADIDRQVPYEWKSVTVEQGERLLKSQIFDSCADVLVARARLEADQQLSGLTSVIADWDGEREAYFLLSQQIKGYDEIRQVRHRLETLSGARFQQIGSGGTATDVTLGGRSH